jgi:hypothetical protein
MVQRWRPKPWGIRWTISVIAAVVLGLIIAWAVRARVKITVRNDR